MKYSDLRAYIAITMYMGFKKLPHIRCYWAKEEIYCGKGGNSSNDANDVKHIGNEVNTTASGKGLGLQCKSIVKDLTRLLHNSGDIVTIDNFFTPVLVFFIFWIEALGLLGC